MNTASRLQAVAPVGGIVAGRETVRASGEAIIYEQLDPVEVKGGPRRVPIWRVVAVRSRIEPEVPRLSTPSWDVTARSGSFKTCATEWSANHRYSS
jgi:hypothetical protein